MILRSLWTRKQQAKQIAQLRRGLTTPLHGQPIPNLLVSLTSFPARIRTTWIAIESILRQDVRPEKVVLALAETEFGVEPRLPEELLAQQKYGLEIIWTKECLKSYGKIIPAKTRYPSATVITIDDDIIYANGTIQSLVETARANPSAIVGHRGYRIEKGTNGEFMPYTRWRRADHQTPSDQCFLTGVGGVLYPPDGLDWNLTFDTKKLRSLCPDADDIWLWGMSFITGATRICLGNHEVCEIKRLVKTPRLSWGNVKRGGNDRQLAQMIDHLAKSYNIHLEVTS